MLAAVFLMDVRTCALCGYQFLRCAVRVLGCVVFYPTWGLFIAAVATPSHTMSLRCVWHLLLIQCYTCDVLCTWILQYHGISLLSVAPARMCQWSRFLLLTLRGVKEM